MGATRRLAGALVHEHRLTRKRTRPRTHAYMHTHTHTNHTRIRIYKHAWTRARTHTQHTHAASRVFGTYFSRRHPTRLGHPGGAQTQKAGGGAGSGAGSGGSSGGSGRGGDGGGEYLETPGCLFLLARRFCGQY